MNRIAYVFKKGPLAKPSLNDAVVCINAPDLAEIIRLERLDKQHETSMSRGIITTNLHTVWVRRKTWEKRYGIDSVVTISYCNINPDCSRVQN